MRRRARRKRGVDAVLSALTNVLSIVYPHVYFPTYSNGLKDVAGCLGCLWTEPDASGIEAVVWRKNWEKTGDALWKGKLIPRAAVGWSATRHHPGNLDPSGRSPPAGDADDPNVFVNVGDPVARGLVTRLDRPGGNSTGFALLEPTLGGKWLELLSEIAP
jgi:hypothetical protein